VVKGFEMFRGANIPVLGIVENMSFFICGACDKKHRPFGEGGARRLAEAYGLPLLAELPLSMDIPSPLGRGEPLLVREEEASLAAVFHDLAAKIDKALQEITPGWAMPDPGGMEV
jgi:ATP-binding protein involved in chromosome partitioning